MAWTVFFLTLFTYLAPAQMLHTRTALVTVTPSTLLVHNSTFNPSEKVDGPSVFLGLLGSCSRVKNNAHVGCTNASTHPVYNLSVLPSRAPSHFLSASQAAAIAAAVGLSFSYAFIIGHTLQAFNIKYLDQPVLHHFIAFFGVIGFLIGLTVFLVMRLWLGKAVDDFNLIVSDQGTKGPQLIASVSNGFIIVWFAYAFHTAPLYVSMVRL
ncbi:hypothetical protein GGX14DRAFT_605711, partial [Mycena pura]